jgi:hypothetical protein
MTMRSLVPVRVPITAAILAATLIVASALVARVSAVTRALPAFSVRSSTGTVVQSSQLSTEHQWLVVFVSPGCVPCNRFLARLGDPQIPTLADRVIVLVETEPVAAGRYITPLMVNGLGGSPWYVDSDGSALTALLLKRTPAVIGVRDLQVEWTVDGVLNDPSGLEQIARAWLGI